MLTIYDNLFETFEEVHLRKVNNTYRLNLGLPLQKLTDDERNRIWVALFDDDLEKLLLAASKIKLSKKEHYESTP